jgi:hypothetical protein
MFSNMKMQNNCLTNLHTIIIVGRVLVEKLVTTAQCAVVGAWEFGQDISRFKKRVFWT